MRLRIALLIFIGALFIFSACSPKHSEIVVAEYGGEKITMNDFEKAYAKNSGSLEQAEKDSIEAYKNFLNLYVNFRMKLRDADIRKYDEDPELKSELENYKRSVGASYIKEKELIEPALKDLYEKKKWEIRVSHIMLRPDSLGLEPKKELADTLIARIKRGEKFEDLAKKYSDDQFSRDMGGDIYYITAGQIIQPFEEAMYKTKPGEIYPEPVLTRYGYHIIKVTEKQKRRHKLKAAHILIDYVNEKGKPDTAGARTLIEKLQEKLKAGAKFEDLAKEYSEDKGSAPKGGELGFFMRRMMVLPFDEAVFRLKVGEVSDIVKTKYGFHLIKLLDEEEYPTFESEKKTLKQIYEKTAFKDDFDAFIGGLKKEFNFVQNDDNIKKATEVTSKIKLTEIQTNPAIDQVGGLELFKVGKDSYTVDTLVSSFVNENKYKFRVMDEQFYESAIDEMTGNILLGEKAMVFDKTSDEFAGLMDDYKNGIFIFKLQEDEIWGKIDVDSIQLKKYYDENKADFTWEDRADFSEIFTRNDSLAGLYYQMLLDGADFDSLAQKYTAQVGFKSKKGRYGIKSVSENTLAKAAFELEKPGDFTKPINNSKGGYSIVKLNKKYPAGIKTFDEARAEIASILQEMESKRLEKEYVNELKTKYEPELYYDELSKAFKN